MHWSIPEGFVIALLCASSHVGPRAPTCSPHQGLAHQHLSSKEVDLPYHLSAFPSPSPNPKAFKTTAARKKRGHVKFSWDSLKKTSFAKKLLISEDHAKTGLSTSKKERGYQYTVKYARYPRWAYTPLDPRNHPLPSLPCMQFSPRSAVALFQR